MNKSKKIAKILIVSALLLLVPLLGNRFISGWNWTIMDFMFAFVFFVFAGLTYGFGISRIRNHYRRTIAGFLLAIVLIAIWVLLATG
jgi:hypothetical protein